MTTFTTGPAKGKSLMLRRAPIFLRVTEAIGKGGTIVFDALDQPEDTPLEGETLYAYVLTEAPGHMHMRCSRESKKAGGFYPIAVYKLCDPQPSDLEMRFNANFRKWCEANTEKIPFDWKGMS